jgi:type I restriction enzyme R subunit
MTARTFTESVVEQAALAWLESLDGSVRHGLEIAPARPDAEPRHPGLVDIEVVGEAVRAVLSGQGRSADAPRTATR